MPRSWSIVPLFLISQATNSYAFADAAAFKCLVSVSQMLNKDGSLVDFDHYRGKEFVIDRDTGRMNGKVTNHGPFGEPVVIDSGGNEQALKVITVYKGIYTSLDYLYLSLYSGDYEKPFIFMTGEIVLSGTCKPY